MKPTRLFICYRREDTLDFAGRLHDRLSARYGVSNVVLDVDNVPIGVHFQKYLDSQIQQCDLLLALIGRHWLEAPDAKGARRLDDPRDFVRIEIESALRRELPIVPVLVGGAGMPREADLPPSLAPLSEINAAEIASNRDFNVHVDTLVRAIDALLKSPAGKTSLAPEPTAPPVPVRAAKRAPVREAKPAPARVPAVVPSPPLPAGSPGAQLMATLRQRLETWRPKTEWIWKNSRGWWSVREQANSKTILRAKPSTNLVRIRIRKNMARPRKKSLKLVHDHWIADSAESSVRDVGQLDRQLKILISEWG